MKSTNAKVAVSNDVVNKKPRSTSASTAGTAKALKEATVAPKMKVEAPKYDMDSTEVELMQVTLKDMTIEPLKYMRNGEEVKQFFLRAETYNLDGKRLGACRFYLNRKIATLLYANAENISELTVGILPPKDTYKGQIQTHGALAQYGNRNLKNVVSTNYTGTVMPVSIHTDSTFIICNALTISNNTLCNVSFFVNGSIGEGVLTDVTLYRFEDEKNPKSNIFGSQNNSFAGVDDVNLFGG